MKIRSLLLTSITVFFSLFAFLWIFPAKALAVDCNITSSGPYYVGGSVEVGASGLIAGQNYKIQLERATVLGVDTRILATVPSTTPFPFSSLLTGSPPLDPAVDLGVWDVAMMQDLPLGPIPDYNLCGQIDIGPAPAGCPAINCTYSELDPGCASGLREVTGCKYGDPLCPTTPVYPVGQCVYAGFGCSTWICAVASPGSCTVSPTPPASADVTGSGLTINSNYRILLNGTVHGGVTTNSSGSFTTTVSMCAPDTYTVEIQLLGSSTTKGCGSFTSTGCPLGKNPCFDTNGDGLADYCETALGRIDVQPNAFAKRILQIGLGLAGGIALILMVIGSVRVLTSSGDQQRLNGGRDMIIAAVSGLLFLIFSVLILRFIGFSIIGL